MKKVTFRDTIYLKKSIEITKMRGRKARIFGKLGIDFLICAIDRLYPQGPAREINHRSPGLYLHKYLDMYTLLFNIIIHSEYILISGI